VVDVFSSMRPLDYLTGLGVGPAPHLNALGVPVVALHIGILNVLWRFGAVVFSFLVVAIAILGTRWVRLCLAMRSAESLSASSVPLLVTAPAVLAWTAMSLISGGWSVPPVLAIGMAWGAYRSLGRMSEYAGDLDTVPARDARYPIS
jgi:hypothetical protein